MKTIIFGPFFGEFGWELCYWHAWVRKFSREFKNSKIVVVSHEKSYPLYHDFVDEFIPVSKELTEKNYSFSGYFPDFRILSNQEKTAFLELYKKQIKQISIKFHKDAIFIPIYPQRKRSHISHALFLIKDFIGLNNENLISRQNPFKGIEISNYIEYLVYDKKYSWDVQTPPKKYQETINLKPTIKGINLFNSIKIKSGIKDFITIFPRKRISRRPDKNWSEENWIKFIKLIIDDLKVGVFICGTPEGTCLHNFKYKNFYNTVFEEKDILLDLQLALLSNSKFSVHGRSGSCYLSMQSGIKTFMPGPEQDRFRICDYDNISDADINYFTEYDVNPKPEVMYTEFKKYFLQNN